jgi:hypothetical protein
LIAFWIEICRIVIELQVVYYTQNSINLRKLQLLFEDFRKNHNLILFGQPTLLANLDFGVNQDISNRVTYSVIAKRLGPDLLHDFILRELDRVGLGHNTFMHPPSTSSSAPPTKPSTSKTSTASLCRLTGKKNPTSSITDTHWRREPMIESDLLRQIRYELPMPVTIANLGRAGPPSKMSVGYFRFLCPNCGEMQATVNPRNNLAHCFHCNKNYNNIDLLLTLDYTFFAAVDFLERLLNEYRTRKVKRT